MDANGNVYLAGTTYGDLGGPNAGLSDGCARKHDPSGTPLWTQQFGTSVADRVNAGAVDASGNFYVVGETDEVGTSVGNTDSDGNVYVTGSTSGELDGANAGAADVFVMRIDGG